MITIVGETARTCDGISRHLGIDPAMTISDFAGRPRFLMEERRRVRLFAELGSTMKLPRSGRGRLSLEVMELADNERPPMIRIPEYVERRLSGGSGGELGD